MILVNLENDKPRLVGDVELFEQKTTKLSPLEEQWQEMKYLENTRSPLHR